MTIDHELQKIEESDDSSPIVRSGITRALFVSLDGSKSFDNVDDSKDIATLYQISCPDESMTSSYLQCQISKSGVLREVNSLCKELNRELATAITEGEIQALICISVSVEVFSETLQAAAKANIPVTGTGGTSLSLAANNFQVRLVGNAGGSVANTSLTRAVSYAHALATDLKAIYRPWSNNKKGSHVHTTTKAPSFRSVLNACLPAFWGVCLLKRLLDQATQILGPSEEISLLIKALENYALPSACAVVAATTSSSSTTTAAATTKDYSSRIMAGILASTVCWQSVGCGILAGYLVSQIQEKVLFWCICQNIPATMTNLITTGGVGATISLVLVPVAPILRLLTLSIRNVILFSVTATSSTTIIPAGVCAFLWGIFCCYGSKVGWYHAVFLPLILIEMECGQASFLGALDELTLVLVCAGVCYGQLMSNRLFPKRDLLSEADLALCRRAVRINLSYGDFVEACYPFMDQHLLLNASCYLASGLSSSLLVILSSLNGNGVPKSLAYLPFPIAVSLAGREWYPMLMASLVAFFLPFLATILNSSCQKSATR